MNNTDMETFWAVLEHGTLTAAAEALFITQPTLTNRIQALEAEVGAQLFHRGKGIRHIELTEAGQRFLPLAYRWQTLLEETKGVAETATREYLRIGAVFSTNQYILPAAYRRFLHRKLPVALWVQTLPGTGYDGAQPVARRELEMALMDGDSFYHPQLELTPLCSEETVVACSPDSPYGDVISPQGTGSQQRDRGVMAQGRAGLAGSLVRPDGHAAAVRRLHAGGGHLSGQRDDVGRGAAGRRPHAGAGGPCADLPSDRPGP